LVAGHRQEWGGARLASHGECRSEDADADLPAVLCPGERRRRGALDRGEPRGTDALFSASTSTYKIAFDSGVPAKATFTDVSPTATSVTTLDPILTTDRYTGRTFISQLLLGCSAAVYTDDDAKSFQNSEGCGPGAAEDHQTLGAGPLPRRCPRPRR